ncbi:DUF6745 domain-containing protein [Limnoglobus roseus]|uniref:DUF6745 domain-containing protein n=1 Tax=Limnoglobus roseus TaxID=2598579 RepID=A0A5C1AIY9_9BACT|nr:hypothetical protein [Limnoglobus roseus]QEL17966.1 hypothetical protein PX52LOC_04980 [Limnoglobus roseus]
MPRTAVAEPLIAEEVADLIRAGEAPPDLKIDDPLVVENTAFLPSGLTVRKLTLANCPDLEELPADLRVRHLEIRDCPKLRTLPAGLACHELKAQSSALVELPDGLQVEFRLDLRGSTALVRLPRGLKIGTLILAGCTALDELPGWLEVTFLDLEGCTRLTGWPRGLVLHCGHLNLVRCTALTSLPPVRDLARLDLRECSRITKLPAGLGVRSWLDVAGSGLTNLPKSLAGVRLRWRGVTVTERIAFRPETITADEILAEQNTEVRRVMLERVGFEWFFERAKAETLDADRDAGGERKLLRLDLPGDEPLVCLSMACPSTGRRYVLRVPPKTKSCRHAAAWMAGFDDPADYDPLIET